jgi:hypothetical protein
MAKMGLAAFLIAGDSILLSRRDEIVALATRYSLAAIYSRREFAENWWACVSRACLCLKGAYQSQVRHGVRIKITLRKLNHQTGGAIGVTYEL